MPTRQYTHTNCAIKTHIYPLNVIHSMLCVGNIWGHTIKGSCTSCPFYLYWFYNLDSKKHNTIYRVNACTTLFLFIYEFSNSPSYNHQPVFTKPNPGCQRPLGWTTMSNNSCKVLLWGMWQSCSPGMCRCGQPVMYWQHEAGGGNTDEEQERGVVVWVHPAFLSPFVAWKPSGNSHTHAHMYAHTLLKLTVSQ